MRKPRDIDAELKALQERARDLKARKTVQFGELVEATGADALPLEALAGVLLAAIEQARDKPEAVARWAERGEAFFRDRGTARTSRTKGASGKEAGKDSSNATNGADAPAGHSGPGSPAEQTGGAES